MRASPSSYSRPFYISPTLVSFCHHPQPRRTLNAVFPSGTGIAAVYTLTLIGQNVVFNQEQERITNSFFSCTLALNAVCTGAFFLFYVWRGRAGLTFLRLDQGLLRSASGGLRSRRAMPRWVPTLCRSPLSSLSPVCFIPLLSLRPRQFHTRGIAIRCDLSNRVSVCGRKLHDQVASLQHLFGHGEDPFAPTSFLNLR
jgi:hypothetical protein